MNFYLNRTLMKERGKGRDKVLLVDDTGTLGIRDKTETECELDRLLKSLRSVLYKVVMDSKLSRSRRTEWSEKLSACFCHGSLTLKELRHNVNDAMRHLETDKGRDHTPHACYGGHRGSEKTGKDVLDLEDSAPSRYEYFTRAIEQTQVHIDHLTFLTGTSEVSTVALGRFFEDQPTIGCFGGRAKPHIASNDVSDGVSSLDSSSIKPPLMLTTFNIVGLIFGKTVGLPLHWMLLQSLHIKETSLLDQKILHQIPTLSIVLLHSRRFPTVAMLLLFLLVASNLAVVFKAASKARGNQRSAVYICCWLALVAGELFWAHVGGLARGYFLVFMPLLLSIGVSLGLLEI